MKKILTPLLLAILCLKLVAQAPIPSPIIYGSSPFQDSLWGIDTTTWQIVHRVAPSLPSFTITGINGLTYDPTTAQTYAILKVSAVSGRVLATIDPVTGICTQVGNLGDNFSSITIGSDGQMYGATGDGATASESFYDINKTNGTKTLRFAMGNGADGEIICFNPDDNHIYHWSGNGTVVMEKFPVNSVGYTPTNIPITGTSGGETFGVLYNGPGKLIISNITSNFKRATTSGVYAATNIMSLPDDLRGLAMPTRAAFGPNTICRNELAYVNIGGGTQLLSHVIYHWGDGNSDTLTVAAALALQASGGHSHSYASGGNYSIAVVGYTGIAGDTIATQALTVNNLPVVALSGASVICSGDSVTLTGSGGGTSQWYLNGSPIVGATTNVYSTNVPGVYNMIKTNLNTCADSAAVGITLTLGSYPVVNLGGDGNACAGTMLDAGNSGATYLWNTGDTIQMIPTNTTGNYSVAVTNTDGCTASDTISLTVWALPVVDLGIDSAYCGDAMLVAAIPSGSTYLWNDNSTNDSLTVTNSGTYFVNVTDTNGCVNSDTVNVVINALPNVSASAAVTSMCESAPPVPLVGTPANGTFSGPGVSGITFTPSVSGAGNHTVTYTYSDTSGCSNTAVIVLSVFANPSVSATASSNTVCTDDANVTLTGTPSGGTFSGTSVSGNSFDPSAGAGNYNIIYTYTDTNSCSGTATISITVDACVGIAEQNSTNDVVLYPNPANNGFTIAGLNGISLIEIMDLSGKVVATQQTAAGLVNVNLENLPTGVYFVRISSEGNSRTEKLMIQR